MNNPYQANGPKGFAEFKYLEDTHDLFVRLDLPGVKKETVVTLLEPSKKAVTVTGDAAKSSKHDASNRKYGTSVGLLCDCCEISNNIHNFVEDGVVRLILSKKKIYPHAPNFCSCKFIFFLGKITSDLVKDNNLFKTFLLLYCFSWRCNNPYW